MPSIRVKGVPEYVALAELTDTVLVTADQRLASSPDPTCRIEVIV